MSAARRVVTRDLDGSQRECDSHANRHAPVVSSNNHTTGTGLLTLLDIVDLIKAFPPIRSLELLSEVVIPDTASEHDGFWRQDILRCTSVNCGRVHLKRMQN